MTGTFQRRFKTWLAAAATAVVCWHFVPGSAIDRAAFRIVAHGFSNPPFFTAGNGSHASPWKLRTFSSSGKPDTRQAPVIVSLGDDTGGFFQSSPPSPIDLAVVLTNFQRLGAKKAATAGVLAWDAPDPIGLVALEKAIGRFDSLVMAAPLSRGAVAEPMPAAFRNASIALDSIHGDTSLLPAVNRIPMPGVILGREKTLAGFQTLESEKPAAFAPLLARWEDRVVFAFPLLTVLQRLDLTTSGMEIRLGEYLKLGPDGPTVPIDRYGRLAIPVKPVSPYAEIPAEALIDGGEDLFPRQSPEPVVLRDDRSSAEPATRAFSKSLPALIAALASDTGLARTDEYKRLRKPRELILLALVALAAAWTRTLPAFPRNIVLLAIAGLCITAQAIAAGTAEIWLPGLAALAAVLCVFGLTMRAVETSAVVRTPAVRKPRREQEPAATPVAAADPAPARPPAKKTAQRAKKRRR